MEEKRGFLRVYLKIALLYGLFGFIDASLASFTIGNLIYLNVVAGISFVFFLFNIVAFPVFIAHGLTGIVYLFPLYHLLIDLFFVGVTISSSFAPLPAIAILSIGFASSIWEILFSIYLLHKFKKPDQ